VPELEQQQHVVMDLEYAADDKRAKRRGKECTSQRWAHGRSQAAWHDRAGRPGLGQVDFSNFVTCLDGYPTYQEDIQLVATRDRSCRCRSGIDQANRLLEARSTENRPLAAMAAAARLPGGAAMALVSQTAETPGAEWATLLNG